MVITEENLITVTDKYNESIIIEMNPHNNLASLLFGIDSSPTFDLLLTQKDLKKLGEELILMSEVRNAN